QGVRWHTRRGIGYTHFTSITPNNPVRHRCSGSRIERPEAQCRMRPKLIQVRVKPNARAASLAQQADGSWVAQVTSPPVEGRRNEELTAVVANPFAVQKSAVSIKSGASGRRKLVRIE